MPKVNCVLPPLAIQQTLKHSYTLLNTVTILLYLLQNQTFFSDDSAGPERVFLFPSLHEVFHASQHQQEQCLKHICQYSCMCLSAMIRLTHWVVHKPLVSIHSIQVRIKLQLGQLRGCQHFIASISNCM